MGIDLKKAIIENIVTGVEGGGGGAGAYYNDGSSWRFTFVQSPGNTVKEHAPAWGGNEVYLVAFLVFMENVPTTAGSYTIDLKLNGTTVLATPFDLTSLTPGTWTVVEIDPTDDETAIPIPTPFQDIAVEVSSDNGDLSGGSGLTTVIAFRDVDQTEEEGP